jgi:hypothetical protein|tara:strand:- start:1952 stop:2365 length:414 start_codon:yes stop_codon:yes gene_type:complete
MDHEKRREAWICAHSQQDHESAFTDAEMSRVASASPFGRDSFVPSQIVQRMDLYIEDCDWENIENLLLRLLSTSLQPGDLSRIQDAELGALVFWLEQRRVTNKNSFGVRLAVVLVSLWSSYIHHLEAVRQKHKRKRK